MAKKYQYQLGPMYASTKNTFQRGVSPMHVESWLTSQAVAYMENGDNAGAKMISDLKAKFRETCKADFDALLTRDAEGA